MSVSGNDLYHAADRAFVNAVDEADWRSVCARSYYSVYHDVAAFHKALERECFGGYAPPDTRPGLHHQLYTRLKNPTLPKTDLRHKLSFRLGNMLQSLHSQRVKSDYEPRASVDRQAAVHSLTIAQNIFALLRGKAFGSPVPRFDPGIRNSDASATDEWASSRTSACGRLSVVKTP
ncbi:MAG TPA: hypothetical protein VL424_18805 [Pararobbsia sp.]|jgi:hypothetical protein|nr:hypothetical protein [Pararobbsia sp.]